MRTFIARIISVLSVVVTAAGCIHNPIGPRTIPVARMDYNAAISRSWDEDLLLNIVRLRYRDSPLFVDVTSVTASYSIGRSAGIGATAAQDGSSGVTASAGIGFNENPVISYSYLSGEQFTQRLLSPLTVTTLATLSQSGWSIERLLLCCVQRINDLENAVTAAGPTPDLAQEFERFDRAAAAFRRMQIAGQAMAQGDGMGRYFVTLKPTAAADGREFRELLNLDPDANRFELVDARNPDNRTQIAVQGRSLLAVLFFLGHAVDVPNVDRTAGKVTLTHDADGQLFDWSRVVGRLLHIRSGDVAPTDSAVRVSFRNHWFWIDDNDLTSKTTFSLVRLLLFLKSGERTASPPVVTIPAR